MMDDKSSVYKENFWTVKIDRDLTDPTVATFPGRTLEGNTKEKYIQGKYVCLWAQKVQMLKRRKRKSGGSDMQQTVTKPLVLWVRKELRPHAHGNAIYVSADLLREAGIYVEGYNLKIEDPRDEMEESSRLKITIVPSSELRYLCYWARYTKAGRIETIKSFVGIIVILAPVLLSLPEIIEPGAAWLLVILGFAILVQAAFAFYEKLGKPD